MKYLINSLLLLLAVCSFGLASLAWAEPSAESNPPENTSDSANIHHKKPIMTPPNGPKHHRAPVCHPKDSSRDFKPSISGGLRKELIYRTIHEHAADVEACFMLVYSKDPEFEGMVGMHWLLDRNGKVMKAFVKESTIQNPEVEKCLVDTLLTWQFPRGQNAGMGQVKHWFVFENGKYQDD